MVRYVIPVTVCLLAIVAHAADRTEYSQTAQAARNGDQILVEVKVAQTSPGGQPQILSAPQVSMLEGKRAQVIVGQQHPAKPGEREGDLESGIRIDVISVRNQDKVVLLTTVVEKGDTVWAEAKTLAVMALACEEIEIRIGKTSPQDQCWERSDSSLWICVYWQPKADTMRWQRTGDAHDDPHSRHSGRTSEGRRHAAPGGRRRNMRPGLSKKAWLTRDPTRRR